MTSISYFNSDIMHTVFSSFKLSEILPHRLVCKQWNQFVIHDPRWKILTIEVIKNRNLTAVDPKSDQSFLPHIRAFCVKVAGHFPDLT